MRLGRLALKCKRHALLRAMGTQVANKRLITLLKQGKAKGDALLHTVVKLRGPRSKRVALRKGGVTSLGPRGLTQGVDFIAASGMHVTGLYYGSMMTLKHTPCAG